jgi:hypothetical protein
MQGRGAGTWPETVNRRFCQERIVNASVYSSASSQSIINPLIWLIGMPGYKSDISSRNIHHEYRSQVVPTWERILHQSIYYHFYPSATSTKANLTLFKIWMSMARHRLSVVPVSIRENPETPYNFKVLPGISQELPLFCSIISVPLFWLCEAVRIIPPSAFSQRNDSQRLVFEVPNRLRPRLGKTWPPNY